MASVPGIERREKRRSMFLPLRSLSSALRKAPSVDSHSLLKRFLGKANLDFQRGHFRLNLNDRFLHLIRSTVCTRKESTPNQTAGIIKHPLFFILLSPNLFTSLFRRYEHLHGRVSSCGCAFEGLFDGVFCKHCYL